MVALFAMKITTKVDSEPLVLPAPCAGIERRNVGILDADENLYEPLIVSP